MPKTDPDCVFCKIIEGKIASTPVNQDSTYIAIRDLNPQAPKHLLVIPKNHIANIAEAGNSNELGALFQKAVEIARQEGLERGFRIVVNTGDEGGQTVHHLHIHVMGGRQMHWPPG